MYSVHIYLQGQIASYGIDWDAPLVAEESEYDTVEVPVIPTPLTQQDHALLCSTVDPVSSNSDYGIDLYIATLSFVVSKVSQY